MPHATTMTFATMLVVSGALTIWTSAAPPEGRPVDEAALADPALDHVPGEILIRYADQAPPGAVAAAMTRVAAVPVRTFPVIGVQLWRLGAGVSVDKALRVLGRRPSRSAIVYAEPNYVLRASDFPSDPLIGELWGLHNVGQTGGTTDADIDAPDAWDVRTDAPGVVVGVIDSGIDYTHEDLAANMWTNPGEIAGDGIDNDGNGYVDDVIGWDFVADDNDPMDDFGHGTHVAGTIGAVGDNGIGVVGVTWTVTLMPLKFLDASGEGTTADAIEAILYAASFQDAGGEKIVRITNNSWGGGRRSNALQDAIEASGAVFVAAAGNGGGSHKHYPAAYSLANIISVAATDDDDQLASFSNFHGSWVDLGAPGVSILSADIGNGYVLRSGTSMAAPHVSGAAALVMAEFPGLTNDDVKGQLLDTVDLVPALDGKTVTGGRLNAAAAVGGSPDSTPADTTPPSEVTDLAIDTAATTVTSLSVSWTAPGDDGSAGTAFLYDVRYATTPIVAENDFDSATEATGEPQPQPAGSPETFTITGLAGGTTYYVALKSIDEAANSSAVSNVVVETTDVPPPSPWTPETVDAADRVGLYQSLAFDPIDEYPSIAYSDLTNNTVKIARFNGVSWDIEVIDSGGPGIDIAFDPLTGLPVVCHARNKLRFLWYDGVSWNVTNIENNGAFNDVTSLAYDGLGRPTISYRAGNGNNSGLKLARLTGSEWTKEFVEVGASARYSSLAFDPGDGYPSIAYSDVLDGGGSLETLKFAHFNGATWDIEVVETGVVGFGVFASLAFDPVTGLPAIAHRGGGAFRARIVRFDGSQWIGEQFDTGTFAGVGASLVFDSFGTPFIGSHSDDKVKVSTWDGLAWTTEVVDPIDSSWRVSLRIAPDETLAISYRDRDNDDVKFARRSD